ncbi:Carbon-nitrogen hydrolase family protein [Candidatus Magnetomoraceae bacterium gMMP-15]
MRIAIHQTNPVLLDLETNLDEIISKIRKGQEKGVDLNIFPEMALTGYFVNQSYHNAALRLDSQEIKSLVAATKGTAAIVGFVEESLSMNFYNSALIALNGEILFCYRKVNLPNYGVFEERKYFASGKHVRVFKLNNLNVAVLICNDLWHPSLPYLAVCQKADVFVSIVNSSKNSMGNEFDNIKSWEIINKFYSRIFGIYNIFVNRVGEETLEDRRKSCADKKDKTLSSSEYFYNLNPYKRYKFWGGSEIINPFGQQIYKAAYYETDEIIAEIDKNLLRTKKIMLPYLRNDDPYFTHRELERILYDKKNEFL